MCKEAKKGLDLGCMAQLDLGCMAQGLGLVYFSSESGNTFRFVEKLGKQAFRLPLRGDGVMPQITSPYVLICPTYSDGEGRGAVPKAVKRFLSNEAMRKGLRGVIGTGNRNFGAYYGHSAKVIAEKCGCPVLYRFELDGTETDVVRVREGLLKLERSLC